MLDLGVALLRYRLMTLDYEILLLFGQTVAIKR